MWLFEECKLNINVAYRIDSLGFGYIFPNPSEEGKQESLLYKQINCKTIF